MLCLIGADEGRVPTGNSNAEGVEHQSPASRSARWVHGHPKCLVPRTGFHTTPGSDAKPFGVLVRGGTDTQGALRDQRFQKSVCTFLIQGVRIVDDRHLASAGKRFETNVVTQPYLHAVVAVADKRLYRDVRFVLWLGNLNQIGMGRSGNLLATRTTSARL